MTADVPLSEVLWRDIGEPYFRAIERHPFFVQMANGELPRETFAYYVGRDASFLLAFSHAISLLAPKLAERSLRSHLSTMSGGLVTLVENHYGAAIVAAGSSLDAELERRRTPTQVAYEAALVEHACAYEPVVGLAFVVTNFVQYVRLGPSLRARCTTVDPVYRGWIDAYAPDEMAGMFLDVVKAFDRLAAPLDAAARRQAREAYEHCAWFELVWWDAMVAREPPWGNDVRAPTRGGQGA